MISQLNLLFFCIMAELAVEESVKYLGQGATNEV